METTATRKKESYEFIGIFNYQAQGVRMDWFDTSSEGSEEDVLANLSASIMKNVGEGLLPHAKQALQASEEFNSLARANADEYIEMNNGNINQALWDAIVVRKQLLGIFW